MTKKEYSSPAIEVYQADIEMQILAGSLNSVTITGLDGEEEEVVLPGSDLLEKWVLWDDAM